ncbi:MAG: hypothetical protein ACREQ5_33195, partial [Candidatus Dormibacteria bacterium]
RERSALARLAADGVDVRVGDNDEKLCIGGDRAWVGSANASYAADTRDWGFSTRMPAVVAGLEAAFARNWAASRSLEIAASTPVGSAQPAPG